MKTLRVAVLSDLHAHDSSVGGGSGLFLDTTKAITDTAHNPIGALLDMISTQGIVADALLCAGDITDKAQQTATTLAWDWIVALGKSMGVSSLVATAGNHDLDSRHLNNKFDPRGVLQQLAPGFPVPDDEKLNDMYWSRNFAVVESTELRVVTLNSAAFHGGAPEEITHGRIADYTLVKMRKALEKTDPKPVNILICHHHPLKHREANEEDDYEVMTNGEVLLDLLSEPALGEWMVVHGHRHLPRIRFASGGNWQPIVFSAGSLSGPLYQGGSSAANQFYVIEFHLEAPAGMGLAGQIRSWDWHLGKGWAPASATSGLPHVTGFGWRGNLASLVAAITQKVTGPVIKWAELTTGLPELSYLMPRDIRAVAALLKRKQWSMTFDEFGVPYEVGAET